ncbi:efflux transporter outer membrane subunit [Pseudomonas stutzeri]|uniref:RND transporter n=1 Tax=Stutzerimonas stutzeri TaxID=316 RepID=A0A2N8S312_STUST|nr:efflux transporter outer membrane subunit [Stutzerimonas stutzeri]MCQ4296584.1 efflux transporter outer membrane subunit [Stutzerimonas stutzeri]PNF81013.1 RND transporter [Stutzerimonas stutzeri]
MRNFAALCIAGLVAGCQLAPPNERPPSPIATQYPTDYQPAGGDRQASEIGWREFFDDPRLQLYVETALQRNRDLRVAVARIEEARGQFGVRGADRYPTLSATADASRGRFPIGSAAGQGAAGGPAGGSAGSSGGTSGQITERFSIGLGISAFELDFWGRVRNLTEAARAEYLSTIEAQRAFHLSLIADVASTYLAIRGAEARMDLAQATLQSRIDGLRIAQVRFDAGITSALDYNQAQALLTQARTELASLKLLRAEQVNYLNQLTGGPLQRDLPVPLPLDEQIEPRQLQAGLPSELLLLRPDILGAEHDLRAARANIGVARAAFFPQISLTGSFGYMSSELNNLISRDNQTWSIGPSLSLPLFDFGRTRGNLTVAQAREDVAVAAYESTIETAFREVADALAGRRYLAEQVAAQEENVATLRRIANLARDRYAEGVVNYLQVLDAERNLFDAEQGFIEVKRAQVQNLVSLYVALGGGLESASAPDQAGTKRRAAVSTR